MLERKDVTWTYSCDVRRTSVVDESAVCLGEGKYFNMTGLHLLRYETVSEDDCAFLTPFGKALKDIRCWE